MDFKSILNSPRGKATAVPRHPLLRPHNSLNDSSDSISSPKPLAQQSLRRYPSIDSDLASLNSQNQSPTPSIREQKRGGLADRLEYYALLKYHRAAASLRRQAKNAPGRLTELHGKLLRLFDDANATKEANIKKYENIIAEDHLRAEGFFPPKPPSLPAFYKQPSSARSSASSVSIASTTSAQSVSGHMAHMSLSGSQTLP